MGLATWTGALNGLRDAEGLLHGSFDTDRRNGWVLRHRRCHGACIIDGPSDGACDTDGALEGAGDTLFFR